MKRSILTITFVIMCSMLAAGWVELAPVENLFVSNSENTNQTIVHFTLDGFERETIIENGERFEKISYQNEGHFLEVGKPALPRFSRLIAIPNYGEVTISVNILSEVTMSDYHIYPAQELQSESEISRPDFAIDNDFYAGNDIFPTKIAEVDEPAIMRDFRLVNVTINPFQYDPASNELRIIQEAEIEVVCEAGIGENTKSTNRKPSRHFETLYRSSILNYDDVSLREDGYQEPSYLFIYDGDNNVLDVLEYLAEWKHEKGFEVNVVNTTETGSNLNQIKAYIQNAYDNWENPPEFVCLVGDAGGTFNIPTGHIDGGMYNGEGDQFYTLLEGDDILADIFLGRLSFNTISELQTIVSKILNYEKEPYMNTTDWYNQTLLVGDPTSSGPSTIDTKMNVRDMIAVNEPDMNFTEVYSTAAGSWVSQITSGINAGVSYFNYRGFANMSGFNNNHINQLNNGNMLPVAVFITCITGDFEGTIDCRSEAFLKAGSPGSPKGAIAAIATATGNTHTCFNNCVDAGIYYGIFSDKIYHLGGALNRGKLALYMNYPGNPGNHVNQFSYWNNLMGDPGMEIWTNVPEQLTVNHYNNYQIGTNYIEISVADSNNNPLENAWVTFLQGEDEIFETGFTDNNGIVSLHLPADAEGEVNITATKHNFIPYQNTFSIDQSAKYVSVLDYQIDDDNNGTSSGNGDGIINPGEAIELSVTLRNTGVLTAIDVVATITSNDNFITILDDQESFGDISAGISAISIDDFDFTVDNNVLDSYEILLEIYIQDDSGDSWTDYILLPISAPELTFQCYLIDDGNNGILYPGETADLQIQLENIGSLTAENVQADLTCWNSQIITNDNQGSFGNILSGATAFNLTDPFEISALASTIPGTEVEFIVHLFNSAGYDDTIQFTFEIGELQVIDPVGPDEFGYYCYDDEDTNYLEAPQYQWIEIDPAYGGTGTDLNLIDYGNEGDIANIALPFDLTFYNEIYTSITICSNGWLSPGISQNNSFMNWTIPGPLGPSPLIAPFWDDLVVTNGNVCYEYFPSIHIFVVEWSRVQNEFDGAEETFEVIFYDQDFYPTSHGNDLIKFQYNVVNNVDQGSYGTPLVGHGQYATVGIEDHTGTIGLEYTYDDNYPITAKPLENEMAIIFAGHPEEHIDPFLALGQIVVSDENNNGIIEYGEEIDLEINLNNIGQNAANNVQAELLSSDQYITFTSNQSTYNNINGFGSAINNTDFSFAVADNCPNEHSIIFQMNITSDEGNWILFFSMNSYAPSIQIVNYYFEDGNNQILDPGENGNLHLEIQNNGGADAFGLNCDISSTDPYLTLGTTNFLIGDLLIGNSSEIIISISVGIDAAIQHEAQIDLDYSTSTSFTSAEDFSFFIAQIPVAFYENFDFFPNAGWTIIQTGAMGTGWMLNPSNAAGGIAPEGACICMETEEYHDYLISPVISTLGSVELDLQFRSAIYENLRNYAVSVQTTDNGINWHTVWSHAGQTQNPHIENLMINTPDVGSQTFQFAFVLDGQPASTIAWVIDEIDLSEVQVVPHGYVAGNVTLVGGSGSVEDVIITSSGISRTPDENGFYLLPVPEGIYDISAALPGYVTEHELNVAITNWQTNYINFTLNEITVNNPPANLVAESDYNDVQLTWEMPGADNSRKSNTKTKQKAASRERDFVGYNIYRNNEFLAQISDILITEFSDNGLNSGDYTYYLTAVYSEGESDPSNSETVTITLASPEDLTYQITGPGMVLLQWDAPLPAARDFNCYRIYRDSALLEDNVMQTFYFNIAVPIGTYMYGVTCVYDGYESIPTLVEVEVTEASNNLIPLKTELIGNHPNPFNPTTTISFELNPESSGNTEIVIFNMKGQKIKQLLKEELSTGSYSVLWDGKDDAGKQVSSGIYFYRMITKDYSATKKMIMLK